MRIQKRDLPAKQYVYPWVDDIHVDALFSAAAQDISGSIGATPGGNPPRRDPPHVRFDAGAEHLTFGAQIEQDIARGKTRRDVVLGSAGFWTNRDAKSKRLAKPRREALRSDH